MVLLCIAVLYIKRSKSNELSINYQVKPASSRSNRNWVVCKLTIYTETVTFQT